LGGKWTTYRKMGKDVLDLVESTESLPIEPSKTENLRIFGYKRDTSWSDSFHFYGSEKDVVMSMGSNKPLSDLLPITESQIIYAIRFEMALSIEDVLSRRTRCLLIDAKESISIAQEVARIMSSELNAEENWEEEQIQLFLALAKNYHI